MVDREPSPEEPVVFSEPRVVRHPSEAKIRVEQEVRVLGRERPIKLGAVVDVPCDLAVVEDLARATRNVERLLREDPEFRRGYVRRWAREDRQALLQALEG